MFLRRIFFLLLLTGLLMAAMLLTPPSWLPKAVRPLYYSWFGESSYEQPPSSQKVTLEKTEPFCPDLHPDWRKRQEIEGLVIEESLLCDPDNPWAVAAFVKGTNNVSMDTLMKAGLSPDTVVLENDKDGDGDPDVIRIKLEVAELNGRSPDMLDLIPAYFIAPGIQPGLWVFAPKTHGMATKSLEELEANPLLRAPSPVIRVEQGDTVQVILENTHYFPHTIHFHGVDHPYAHHENHGNDGVPETSELPVMPGESRTYVFGNPAFQTGHGEVLPGNQRVFELAPRQPGTMFYHCHVQPQHHIHMGLQGMFVVEENRPNNWVQTLNIGAGHVRYPSIAVRETYAQEYDLHFQDIDPALNNIIQTVNDPRLIEKAMNRQYNITERTARYFLLNGRSFPYTFRESLIVVEPNQHIKLRVLSGGEEGLSLHSHGHKMTITHEDGVALNAMAQITRDVFWLSTAQRLDLHLNTTNDGLHSYGEGVWMLHDHKERAFTTDGMHPGGSVGAIVSRSYLDEKGWPKMHGVDWTPFFMPSYYKREIPVWTTYDKEGMLGETERNSSVSLSTAVLGLLVGVALGGVIGLLIARRSRRLHMLLSPFFLLGTVLLLSRPVAAQTPREQPGTPHHHHQHPNHQDHHAMDMEGMVMNENKDQLPQDCAALAGEQDIIVRAGKKYAQQFNGTMFAYDQQEWDVAPCTKVTVTLINEDQVRHQWMIHGLPRYLYPEGMFHLEVNGAGKKSGTFIVPSAAKTYLVHCDVAQHMEKGMKAQLKVGGGNGDLPSIPGLTSPRQPDIYDTKWSWWRSRVAVVFGIIGAALVVRKRRSRS